MYRAILQGHAWIIVIIGLVVGCADSVDKQLSTPGVALRADEQDLPDGPDRPSDRRADEGTAGPPAMSSGGMTLTWPGGRSVELSNWSMVIDIMEGPEGRDSAEISLTATDASMSDRLSFTLFQPEITPETFRLPGSYRTSDSAQANGSSLAISRAGETYVTKSGRIDVASYEAGKVVGSFVATVAPETRSEEAIEVRAGFEGLVHFACNALAPRQSDAGGGAAMRSNAGPTWTSVGIDDPFCAAYL